MYLKLVLVSFVLSFLNVTVAKKNYCNQNLAISESVAKSAYVDEALKTANIACASTHKVC